MRHLRFTLTLLACLAAFEVVTYGQDTGTKKVRVEDKDYWNQFRGSNGDGKSLAKNLPVAFSETKNVRWKTPIHDKGWSSPVVWSNQIWLTTGVSKRLLAVRPSGTGDVTDTHIVWSLRKFVPNMPSPLIVDDLLFMVSDQGYASCLEAKAGRELWRERLRAGGDHWASPLYADGKIYFCGKKGIVSVIAAEQDFQLLAENRFEASFIASPAIAGDNIILRSLTHLYCIAQLSKPK